MFAASDPASTLPSGVPPSEPSEPPPSVRSYFLEPAAEMNMTRVRITTVLIASAILLFALLVIAIAVKFGGVAVI